METGTTAGRCLAAQTGTWPNGLIHSRTWSTVEERTTLQVPRPLLAKIRKAGHKGQTYADIIEEALKALHRERLWQEHYEVVMAMKEGREPFRML